MLQFSRIPSSCQSQTPVFFEMLAETYIKMGDIQFTKAPTPTLNHARIGEVSRTPDVRLTYLD